MPSNHPALCGLRALRLAGVALAIGLPVAAATVAFAGTGPDAATMVYRGNLQQNGAPYTGQANLGFDFYDAQSGGNCLDVSGCPATPQLVQVLDGEFSVTLTLPPAVLQSQSPYLQVTVGGTTLQGRQRLYPVPFAQRGRTMGPFVAEDELDVAASDGGALEVAVGQNRANASGREIDFPQQAGDDSVAGTITYQPDYGSGTQPYLDIVGAGTGPNRQVHVSDNLSTNQDVSVGRNLAVSQAETVNGALTANGSATFKGATSITAVGGNVLHACEVIYNNPSCSNGTTSGCGPAQCNVTCPAGYVAIGGGANCTPGYYLWISQPWDPVGGPPNGGIYSYQTPQAWATVCATGSYAQCGSITWVECCQY